MTAKIIWKKFWKSGKVCVCAVSGPVATIGIPVATIGIPVATIGSGGRDYRLGRSRLSGAVAIIGWGGRDYRLGRSRLSAGAVATIGILVAIIGRVILH